MNKGKKNIYPVSRERIRKQKNLLVKQLKKTPVIEIACQKVDIGRSTLYRWRREDGEFDRACFDAVGLGVKLVNDLAESKLIGHIQDGNFPSIRFWLQNHHGSYTNKLQISTEQKQELTSEEKKLLEQAYERLGLIKSNETLYEEPNFGSADAEPNSDKQDGETGSSD